MLKYIIVDDEPLAHEVIEEFCGMIPHLKLEKNCFSAMQAMQYLNTQKVDFMFLDINMPKLKGLDFLKTLRNPPKTIITTAYKEYALEGYELNVVDYLLKPFSFDRLVKAVNKIPQNNVLLKTDEVKTHVEEKTTHFFVKADKKHHRVDVEKLHYLEAYGNYTKLYLDGETIVSNEKISHYEKILLEKNFMRTHKSFIVAIDKIKFIEGNRIIIDEKKIPIGQTYKKQVYNLVGK